MNLDIDNVTYSYDKHLVLDGISFDVKPGEILGILGPNGCGKSTLLKNLNRNLSPDGGCVLLNGDDIEEMAKKDIAKEIAVVPQTNEINFAFTVKEVVSMGRMPFQRMLSYDSKSDEEIVENAIRQTGLAELKDRRINTMSGGERQRVIIARAIAQTPKIILMDEPTLHLDISMQFDALNLVYRLAKKNNLTVIIVSHDLPMVARYCDRILMLHNRKIHAIGTPGEVLTPDNIKTVFNVDGELLFDEKTGKNTVVLHNSYTSSDE